MTVPVEPGATITRDDGAVFEVMRSVGRFAWVIRRTDEFESPRLVSSRYLASRFDVDGRARRTRDYSPEEERDLLDDFMCGAYAARERARSDWRAIHAAHAAEVARARTHFDED